MRKKVKLGFMCLSAIGIVLFSSCSLVERDPELYITDDYPALAPAEVTQEYIQDSIEDTLSTYFSSEDFDIDIIASEDGSYSGVIDIITDGSPDNGVVGSVESLLDDVMHEYSININGVEYSGRHE